MVADIPFARIDSYRQRVRYSVGADEKTLKAIKGAPTGYNVAPSN